MPLKVLGVDRCVITAKHVNNLKKHIEEFCWDGDEGTSSKEWGHDDDYGWGSSRGADFLVIQRVSRVEFIACYS